MTTTNFQFTEHFDLEQLTFSESGVRAGLKNDPTAEALNNLRQLANALENLRIALGNQPILVSSGYRSPEVNKLVGGVPSSAHVLGGAADIRVPDFGNPLAVCREIVRQSIPFGQIIHEHARWCHFSILPVESVGNRVLTIDKLGTRVGLLDARS